MSCAEHQQLLNDEANGWAAYNELKSSKDQKDEKELLRRSDNASDASTKLRLHLATCPKCKTSPA
jgi:hypothetical protein